MARSKNSRGFTLVELLVVITIIGMLVSLLLPAIQAAREAGRRNTCSNNMRQATLALMQFQDARKGFPGYANIIPKLSGSTNSFVRASWVVPILPNLERNDLYQNWQNPATAPNFASQESGGNRELFLSYMAILVCPSDANPDLGDNPLSYVVNTGCAIAANESNTIGQGGLHPSSNTVIHGEDPNSGVFFNHSVWDGQYGNTGTITPVGFAGGRKVNMDFLGTNDGSSYTLMMSENLQAQNWATDAQAGFAQPFQYDMTIRAHTGMVWYFTGNDLNNTNPLLASNAGPPLVQPIGSYSGQYNPNAMGINDSAQVVSGLELTYNSSQPNIQGGLAFSRPSSNHPGGVNAYFCDGHQRFLADGLDYRVWTQLMTPNQKGITLPHNNNVLATSQQGGWRYILNESDY